jgi:hypothetical protein
MTIIDKQTKKTFLQWCNLIFNYDKRLWMLGINVRNNSGTIFLNSCNLCNHTYNFCHRVYIRVEHKGHVVQINNIKRIISKYKLTKIWVHLSLDFCKAILMETPKDWPSLVLSCPKIMLKVLKVHLSPILGNVFWKSIQVVVCNSMSCRLNTSLS